MTENENNLTSRHRILILGNGFDLYHMLPTSYADFLDICGILLPMKVDSHNGVDYSTYYERVVRPVEDRRSRPLKRFSFDSDTQTMLDAIYQALSEQLTFVQGDTFDRSAVGRLYHDLDHNLWYEYFQDIYEHNRMNGTGWIDFEREISAVEDWLDDPDKHIREEEKLDRIYSEYVDHLDSKGKMKLFFDKVSSYYHGMPRKISIRQFSDDLYACLNDIEEALEMYLIEFVSRMEPSEERMIPELRAQDFDCVLSYNYTDTFRRYYDHGEDTEYCYIHGRCRDAGQISESDSRVILGTGIIEDNESSGNFTVLRKFMQRGMKGDANVSRKWIAEMQEAYDSNHQTSEIWICGHSLDVTDRDTLVKFIEPDYANVHIVCRKSDTTHLIRNLAKMIGNKRLGDSLNSYPRRISFEEVLQE